MTWRRGVAGLLTAGLFAARFPTWAAQPPARRFTVGVLVGASLESAGHLVVAFEAAMRELGYDEGRNIAYERRWANGQLERLPELAAELVRLRVDAILTSSLVVIEAARNATATIPIVMAVGAGFPGKGWIASLAKPGGNLTGLIAEVGDQMGAKRLQLLKQTVPSIAKVATLMDWGLWPQTEAAAKQLGLTLNAVLMRVADDLEKAFGQIERERPDALYDASGTFGFLHRQRIANFLLERRMPAIGTSREVAQAGYLLAYSVNLRDHFRRAAIYVDRILRGTSPGELPIEQSRTFELVVNARTARVLGIMVPGTVLLSADEVIE